MGATTRRRPESSMRSFLFSPGADDHKIAKAVASDADAVILDLEDAVAESRKAEARSLVSEATRQHGESRPIFVRVNAVPTGLISEDLAAVCMPELAGVWVPKAESVDEIGSIDNLLSRLEAERAMPIGSVRLLLSFETARGVYLAHELASACDRVAAVSAGTAEGGDLHAEMGGIWSDDVGAVPYVRARIALAARAAGISCIVDGACTRLDDEVVAKSAQAAHEAGYTGKMAIHPRHIEPIHRAFAPSEGQISHAREVIEAFALAEADGTAAISVGGMMIDYAMVVNARRVLGEAESRDLGDEHHD